MEKRGLLEVWISSRLKDDLRLLPLDGSVRGTVVEAGNNLRAELIYVRAFHGYKDGWIEDKSSSDPLFFVAAGLLDIAEEIWKQGLQGEQEAGQKKHLSTLDNLGNICIDQWRLGGNQDKLDDAEKMFIRAMQGYEETLGPKHISTLETVNNLGNLYVAQGKLPEAEKMYSRALQGKEESVGLEHISTLSTVNNLGNLYAAQGRLDRAEEMYRRALWHLPGARPTLDVINNLANLYMDQGQLDKAEERLTFALKVCEGDIPLTLRTVINLGILYAVQGKMDEAEKMFLRAKESEALGPGHPLNLYAVNCLSYLYAAQRKGAEASLMLALGAEIVRDRLVFHDICVDFLKVENN